MTVRLNLGAGDDRRQGDGWINVDQRADVADVVASADDLSAWEDSSVDELQALDLLEHFWRDDVERVLAEWHRVLRPGGLLTLRVPNLMFLGRQLFAAAAIRDDTATAPRDRRAADELVEKTIRNVYGGHRWGPGGAWDTHHWGYTPTSLERTLERCGFAVLSNDRAANMTVVAQR